MPCNCGKNALPRAQAASAAPRREGVRTAARVAVYQVVVDGEVKVATSSPTAAREEARRLGASIRVTSRPVEA